MKLGIEVKIDVKKIEKARLYVGEKCTYLTMTTFIDTENTDQYGNHGFIAHEKTKEEKESKTNTPILGNCKIFYEESNNNPNNQPSNLQASSPSPTNGFDDDDINDIPF